MKRTRQRHLVKGRIDPLHAFTFGTVAGVAGVSLLATAVNPLTAVLGGANIFLYAGVYTPLKRISISNTVPTLHQVCADMSFSGLARWLALFHQLWDGQLLWALLIPQQCCLVPFCLLGSFHTSMHSAGTCVVITLG